jgi:hypothetical protein
MQIKILFTTTYKKRKRPDTSIFYESLFEYISSSKWVVGTIYDF